MKPIAPPSIPKNYNVVIPIRKVFDLELIFLDIAKSPKIVH